MRYMFGHITKEGNNSFMSWLLFPLLVLCLTACSSDNDEPTDIIVPENPHRIPTGTDTKLYVYVYKPNTAVPTRAYVGDVDPISNEDVIYQLQIWIFTHDNHKLIGYFSSTESSALKRR